MSNKILIIILLWASWIKIFTITEMWSMRSSSFVESLAGSSVGSGRLTLPSWWWMWKRSVPFSSHCCRQRTRGMSSEFPEISNNYKTQDATDEKLSVVAMVTDLHQNNNKNCFKINVNSFFKQNKIWIFSKYHITAQNSEMYNND